MLSAATHRLHGSPHVGVVGHQIPTRFLELARIDATAFVNLLQPTGRAIVKGVFPDYVAVTLDDSMRAATFERFLRIERWVDSAENNDGAQFIQLTPEGIATQGVTRVDSDADHIAGLYTRRIELL